MIPVESMLDIFFPNYICIRFVSKMDNFILIIFFSKKGNGMGRPSKIWGFRLQRTISLETHQT